MKQVIRTPYFEIGTKNYIYGDKVLEYAIAADKAAEKYDIDVLFICPAVEIRRFPICDYEKIDGCDLPLKTAVYMADSQAVDGSYSICGTINYIEEIEYVKHSEATGTDLTKTRFSISLTDCL